MHKDYHRYPAHLHLWTLLPESRGRPHLVESEEVEELVGAHALQAGVVLADDGVSDAHLEFLQAHDLLLQRASSDQPVHVDDPFLHSVDTVTKVSITFNEKAGATLTIAFHVVHIVSLVSERSSSVTHFRDVNHENTDEQVRGIIRILLKRLI